MAQFSLIMGYLVGILCLVLTLGFPTAQGSETSKPTTSLTMLIDCPNQRSELKPQALSVSKSLWVIRFPFFPSIYSVLHRQYYSTKEGALFNQRNMIPSYGINYFISLCFLLVLMYMCGAYVFYRGICRIIQLSLVLYYAIFSYLCHKHLFPFLMAVCNYSVT